ncbi:MAG: hypothetical protein K0S12_320 [Bacteroidetes bacterium]|jgi:hypothetical protein|nr:hypothetical protein [Bacteroidota bacterium]
MRKILFFFLIIPSLSAFAFEEQLPFLFIENKGQFSNQFNQPRKDILFGASAGELTFHFKRDGVSYQQYRVEDYFEEKDILTGKIKKVAGKTTIQRVDVEWVDASPSEIITGKPSEDYTNYYFDVCPQGVHNVASFDHILYKEIYKGIDLKWYSKNGRLKYDFLISAGAGYQDILFRFSGTKSLSISKNGELIIETPLGKIIEEAPYVLQNGKSLKAFWILHGNTAGFHIPGYDKGLPMIIDPGVRQWGTYYGGAGDDVGMGCATDNMGNVYMSGYSTSIGALFIATTGSHQSSHGGGLENAFLAKFKSAGVRLWATYYGGNARDIGFGCATDNFGNVFLCGQTLTGSPNVMASGGHQNVHGGNWDAYLVKFNSAGVRQWATYYGGNNEDNGYCCVADPQGNVYMTGKTRAQGNIIATPGAHQIAAYGFEEAFLVKFNSNGTRVWGTFYGAEDVDIGFGCAIDSEGNVYMSGHTNSTVNISTPGCHQSTHATAGWGWDAFLAKFDENGVRLWGTYYGGNGNDMGYGCAVDHKDNIYMSGKSDTYGAGNIIAIDGAHQTTFAGGNSDAFLVKFKPNGVRLWGTYYGGGGEDCAYGCAVNVTDHVYLSGYSGSSGGTSIATPNGHQPVFGGFAYDGFLALFNEHGNRQWGSYYGGGQTEVGRLCTTDQNYNVYLVGLTDTYTSLDIATPGSHQSSYNGGFAEGFLVRFYDCTPPLPPGNSSPLGNQNICSGNSATLHANGMGFLSWYNSATSTTPIGTGSVFTSPALGPGTYTYFVTAATCAMNPNYSPITVTVNPLPALFVTSANTLTCPGETVTLSSAGVSSYTWSTGSNVSSTVVNPTVTTTYTVSGTSPNGCVNSAVITQSVGVCVGLKEEAAERNQISVYPNPAADEVIVSNLPASCLLTMYNALGEIILSEKPDGSVIRMDVSELKAGVYLICVNSGKVCQSFKIVKN